LAVNTCLFTARHSAIIDCCSTNGGGKLRSRQVVNFKVFPLKVVRRTEVVHQVFVFHRAGISAAADTGRATSATAGAASASTSAPAAAGAGRVVVVEPLVSVVKVGLDEIEVVNVRGRGCVRGVERVQCDAGNVKVWHDFEDDVLVSVAEGGAEGIGGVGRRGPVQDDGSFARLHLLSDVVPTAERRNRHRRRRSRRQQQRRRGSRRRRGGGPCRHRRWRSGPRLQRQVKHAAMIHIEIVMPWVIGVKHEFLDAICPCVKQNVKS